MPGLAAGLAAGLQGFQRGRQQRDERFAQEDAVAYKRQQDQMAQERQARQDQMQSEMQAASLESMRQAQAAREAEALRRQQLDRRDAADRGEVSVDQANAEGTNLMSSYGGGAMGDAMTKAAGALTVQKAKTPAYSIGGEGYVKTRSSLAEQSAERAAAARAAERGEDRAWRDADRTADQTFTSGENEKSRAQARALAGARPPSQPHLVTGADGNMYEYRGGQMVPVPIAGANPSASQPTDQPSTTQVPAVQRGLFGKPADGGILTGEAAKRAESVIGVIGSLESYRNMLKTTGTAAWSGDDVERAKLDTQYGNLQMALKEAFNLGVLNGPDLALMEKQLTPPTGAKAKFWKGQDALLAQVDQTIAGMNQRKKAMGEVYGPRTTQTLSGEGGRGGNDPQSKYNDPGFQAFIRQKMGGRP